MTYDFDQIIDRSNTNSLKYDFARERGKPDNILPLWVADMDFPTAPEILHKLHSIVDHGIFGYTDTKNDYADAVINWFFTYFHYKMQPSWLIKTPGVVYAIATAVRAFTQKGDSVLIQQPVYYPFGQVVRNNDRNLVVNSLVLKEERYQMDFEDFEKKIIEEKVKLFIFCSPHNPVGRVWTKEELLKVGEICLKHRVLIVSDEIHGDFTYPGHQHIMLSSLSEDLENNTITCTSPSKTFNLAGLQVSNIFIPNPQLRKAFRKESHKSGYNELNILGLAACQAAYTQGGPWLSQLKSYLKGNLDFVRSFCKEYLPEIKLIEPEGTYLIWLDFRKMGLDENQLEKLIVEDANLWLDGGTMFGEEGAGFQRINLACPRSTLEKAFNQLRDAIVQYKKNILEMKNP